MTEREDETSQAQDDTTQLYRAVHCARESMRGGVDPRPAVVHAANRYQVPALEVAMLSYAAHTACAAARDQMKPSDGGPRE